MATAAILDRSSNTQPHGSKGQDRTSPTTEPSKNTLPQADVDDARKALGSKTPLVSGPNLESRATEAYEAMHGGMWGTGTDEERLLKALEGLSPEEVAKLKEIYADHYGRDLVTDVRDELDGNDLTTAEAALSGNKISADAARLERAIVGAGTDDETVYAVLAGKSPEEIKALKEAYLARTGRTIEEDLRGDLSGYDLERAEAMLRSDDVGAKTAQVIGALDAIDVDEATVLATLREASPAERAAIAQAYRQRTGHELSEAIKPGLSTDEIDEAQALLAGDIPRADAAVLRQAMSGYGADEDKINEVFDGKTAEERQAIIAAYKAAYGTDLMSDLTGELDSRELHHTRLLIENGKLTDAQKIFFAVEGIGTDVETIREVLAGKSKEEIAAIRAEYATLDPGGLDEALAWDLGGRDEFDAFQDLKGEPTTAREQLERLNEKRAFEKSGIFSGVVDVVTDKDELLDQSIERFEGALATAEADGVITAEEQARLDQLGRYGVANTKSYIEAKNSVAETAATVAATAAATAVVVGTAGLATPVVVAAATAAGAVAYTGVKAGIQGSAYDGQDVAADLAIGGVEGAVTAATMGTGKVAMEAARQTSKQVLKEGAEQLAKTAAKETAEMGAEQAGKRTLMQVGTQITKDGAAAGAAGEGIRTATSSATWKHGFAAGLGEVGVAIGGGAVSGAAGEIFGLGVSSVGKRAVGFFKKTGAAGEVTVGAEAAANRTVHHHAHSANPEHPIAAHQQMELRGKQASADEVAAELPNARERGKTQANPEEIRPEHRGAVEERVERAMQRLERELGAQWDEIDQSDLRQRLTKKATDNLLGQLQATKHAALRQTVPDAPPGLLKDALRGGHTPEDILSLAIPEIRQHDSAAFAAKLKEFESNIATTEVTFLEKWKKDRLNFPITPKEYPRNHPDADGLWPVTPRFNPDYESPSSSVTREIKEKIYDPVTGYKKNPRAKELGSQIKIDPEGRLLDPDSGKSLHDGKYIFVVDKDGKLILGTRTTEALPHPCLIGGKDPRVYTAGEITIENGKVMQIDNQTGHFRVNVQSVDHALYALGDAWEAQYPGMENPFSRVPILPWSR